MTRFLTFLILCVTLAGVAGCSLEPQREWNGLAFANASLAGTNRQTYALNPQEQKLDCKELTGRMQVRILQVRDYLTQPQSTTIATGLHRATNSMFGTNKAGSDPDSQYATDRAMLEAYNQRLGEKNCKKFALDDELKPKPATVTPSPTIAPATTGPQKK